MFSPMCARAVMFVLCAGLCLPGAAGAAVEGLETVTFEAADGLAVTADLYLAHEDPQAPLIILFHQAGWSRGEYRETAPKLNAMGFNCIAVDQRSGGEVNGVVNETARAAEDAGLATGFVDAYADMEAALMYARENHAAGPVLVLGSSYSASLVFHLAADHPEEIDALLAFSPGEYFERFGKPAGWVAAAAARVRCPVFITAARDEAPRWAPIYAAIDREDKASYTPDSAGQHGSRALWERFDGHGGYWDAVSLFFDAWGL